MCGKNRFPLNRKRFFLQKMMSPVSFIKTYNISVFLLQPKNCIVFENDIYTMIYVTTLDEYKTQPVSDPVVSPHCYMPAQNKHTETTNVQWLKANRF